MTPEEEIRRALAPVLTHRVKQGHDAAKAIAEAAGGAYFAACRTGAFEGFPLPPALITTPVPGEPLLINDGQEIDAWFELGDANTYERTDPIRSVGLHWTGGPTTRTARQVSKVLRARDLSVHYVVEGDGDVWQLADDETQCAHIGDGNEHSIGIECTHPGFDKRAPRQPWLGRRYRLATWEPVQLESLVLLVELLCERWEIPRRLAPMERGVPLDFHGVVGHFNWHETRTDPGPAPFEALRAAGFEQT